MNRRHWISVLAVTAVLTAAPMAQNRPRTPATADAAARPAAPATKEDARTAKLKAEAVAAVDGMQVFTQQMVDSIFSFGELGFQEVETNRYLIDILEKNGFTVQKGSPASRPRSSRRWGSGKPVIALGSDIDGIPQASQKPGVGYSRPDHRRRARPRRRPQLGSGAQHHRRDRREEDHGAREPAGHDPDLDGYRRGARRHEGVLHPRGPLQGRRRRALHARRRAISAVSWGERAGTGLVSVQYSFRGQTAHAAGGAVARAQRARRRRADGHRLELPPRAPAARAALALRHHRRRRSAQRRPAHGVGLVLLPRDRPIRRSRSSGRPATTSPRRPR